MIKFSKFISLALVTTMVLGSSFTSFAAYGDTRTSIGTGSTEGHVNQEDISIVLPTDPVDGKYFDYMMDPERLITKTAHIRYQHTKWPGETDTGVYFNNGVDPEAEIAADAFTVFANTSLKTSIKNKSSVPVDIVIKAEAVAEPDSDNPEKEFIPLTSKDGIGSAQEASLYLGLAWDVKGDATVNTPIAVTYETAAEKLVTLEGTPGNYDYAYDSATHSYIFEMKDQVEDESWASMEFYIEGAVTEGKEVADNIYAPDIRVTWSWENPVNKRTVTFDTGVGGSKVESQKVYVGGNATRPTVTPTRLDVDYMWHFDGWFAENSGMEFNFEETPIIENITLYAHWSRTEPREYTSENVTIGLNSTGKGLVLRHSNPSFTGDSVVGFVALNDDILDSSEYTMTTTGALVITNCISESVDEYVVKAVVDGVGYTATYEPTPLNTDP